MNYTVIFKIEGSQDIKTIAQPGDSLLDLALNNGINIDAPCSGNGTCGKCKVRLISGTVETTQSSHISKEDFADNWRLACQSKVNSDAIILVPKSASAFKSEIVTADLGSQEELDRYQNAISEIFDAGIQRGTAQTGVGIAVDIGTTTVTAAMLDLATGEVLSKASLGNGQIKYGADVINRIIVQQREGGVEKLMKAVREETLIPIFQTLCKGADKQPEEINRIVIAGNTTMEHLLLGANGDSIRLEPYEPEFLEREGDTAASVGLPANPDAPVIFAPNVGSYVGGDITAGVLPAMLWNKDEMNLFIDLGTNGELVFGNRDYMLTCACSAGPAFEGGDITCGMRATKGAVDSVHIDEETLNPTLSVIGGEGVKPLGLCGSGLISIIAELFRTGAISAKGKFAKENPRITHDEYGMGYYAWATADESGTGKDITINESDLDNFIRAKGAIFSAIRTMLASVEMTIDDIDKVIIAGGIGQGIDIEKAISIGMLPKQPLEKYAYIGNSSLTGACAMLLSDEATQKVFDIDHNMTYIELSTHPGYMDEFVASCFIPHTDASLFR
ncbi:MAG: ASKHA domain-containing protein [Clostridia bacterium]|nr:ASKHA domain-containing protein [Clostridia bacterium]